MALIDVDSKCALCGELLGDAHMWLATTAVGLRPPLARMDDSAAHHECLRNWDQKQEFVDAYNSRCPEPELTISEEGYVQYIRPERPLITWYEWLAMPLLLPMSFGYHTITGIRDRICR